ncbi:MAG: SUMF1/EgtB/PvdO family nonheme iron enzyme, partial [Pirellulales bacterium]|nr:SUMF1/EgtB/PvdO family nonheme iron enzyme [Pirellulales bacterium]
DPDPGIHAAAGWVLQRCPKGNLNDSMARHRRELQSSGLHGDRQWYINGQDHTMIIVPGPTQFLMGAADGAASDLAGQKPHNQRIRRSFSIASMETTVEQFQKFLADHPSMNHDPGLRTDGKTNGPQTSVTWYEAAAYCNWLSESEGLPPEERCYLPNDQGSYAAGMQLAPDYLERRGYRLPTEAEWEYACRAGATTAYAFGTDVSYLEYYGISQSISDGFPRSCGTKKPNDLGLFDMHGNVSEWCQERDTPSSRDRNGSSANSNDFERSVQDSDSRIVRGGSFLDQPAALVSMARNKENSGKRKRQIGFRVARSYP